MTTRLLIIDPQNDFCDGPAQGALAVPGAWDDMVRLAGYIDSHGTEIDDITVTLDSHHLLDIGHPGYWRDAAGREPAPFTPVSAEDVRAGRITPADVGKTAETIAYLEALEARGRYVHTVWPPHCLIGTHGHAVQPDLMAALGRWSALKGKTVDFVLKGLNPSTEHYSAIKAEVPDGRDLSTAPNAGLVDRLRKAERLIVAGEALSHCVKSTLEDYLDLAQQMFGDEAAPRLVVLTDATSPVPAIPGGPDFPAIGQAFLADLETRGAKLVSVSD